MLDYVYGHDELVAHAVAQMIPHVRQRGFINCKAIGVTRDGKLIAGVVYHNWNQEADRIEVSGAALPGTRWLTRETIRRMYEFPFEQMGVQAVVQHTPTDNTQLLRQLAAGGYIFCNQPRWFGRDRDGVYCLLTREAWEASKFIRRPNRIEIEEAA